MQTHYEMMMSYDLFPFKDHMEGLNQYFNRAAITYEQLVNSQIGRELTGLADTVEHQRFLATYFAMMFHTYHFQLYHHKIYSITQDLAEMLFQTKLSKVPLELIKSPYPEILIEIPPTFLKILNEYSGEHNVSNIYVHLVEHNESDKELRICVVGLKNDISIDHYDDALFYFRLHFQDDNLEKVVEDCANSGYTVGHPDIVEYNNKKLKMVFQFVLNCLLYITGADCDIRLNSRRKELEDKIKRCKSGKKKKYERQLINLGLDKYIVGGSIKLSRAEKDGFQDTREGNEGHKHKVRTLVQGHWRQQAYGKQRSFRKALWIKPFWRGPEFSEMIHKKHVVS